jgi:hypothetical protein
VGDRLFLEIVAEREVAQHLEERVVARGVADVVEVVVLAAGAHALLRGRGARHGARFQPVNTFLNGTMPAFVNIRVGSLYGTSGALCTTSCPCEPKYSRKDRRISFVDVMSRRLSERSARNKHVSPINVIAHAIRPSRAPARPPRERDDIA